MTAPSPIQPAVGGAEDDLADRAATLFERAIMAGFAPADAQIAALTAALASTSPAQTGEPTEGNWISADDYYRNVKALDEALNGSGGATRPLLIDVLSQVQGEVRKRGAPILATGGVDQAWVGRMELHADRLEAAAIGYGGCSASSEKQSRAALDTARKKFDAHLSTALGAAKKE